MMETLFGAGQSLLLALPPEVAHETTLRALEMGCYPRHVAHVHPKLEQTVWGMKFPNPLGIAAGFDKDARVVDAVLAMGCGFAEVGTVTPKPQSGNPTPRLFRLPREGAVINRLGFNNGGHDAALKRLQQRRDGGIVGVNIGANKDTKDRAEDYVAGIEKFYDVANYFTVNISSPNTPGLRELQAPAALDDLVGRVMDMRAKLIAQGKPRRPVIVKIAPDIAEEDIAGICDQLVRHHVDGIAVSNTTLARPGISGAIARQGGGLSGRPLFDRSTAMLGRVYVATEGKIPLIGIGGIDSGERALTKIRAGATLIQLYTGLIFNGPGLIKSITQRLARACEAAQVSSIQGLVGIEAETWANRPLDA
ncbi:Dihydroorotate dehydrogenase (quinone) [Candidatus Filomicrobium marinum]|uniref:Dihydroorotate dehydrogenase (quinone) n=2 Tax=Filomicrobium TaxID=119044 RepID=A0A0D6JEP0_9HYPH|nr:MULTISPECIES: quinone-dependent dihydroorotate dehydrogenase [Filomicrobium]CFX20302.1 Dihydroorotate dehydrogenase (quinone) [Candidatus Filomicrobium marinum]CPR18635.1 Dihydroorotate dehydrogenase (quinone) [Candidatus Filomicrobium marinum]SDO16105.1 dihydroorotate oxidase A [Filomicrobium insigne]